MTVGISAPPIGTISKHTEQQRQTGEDGKQPRLLRSSNQRNRQGLPQKQTQAG